jgi:hypothetical protein
MSQRVTRHLTQDATAPGGVGEKASAASVPPTSEKSRRSDAPPHTRRPQLRVPPFLLIPRREFPLASHLEL